jgi:hypothetical protein
MVELQALTPGHLSRESRQESSMLQEPLLVSAERPYRPCFICLQMDVREDAENDPILPESAAFKKSFALGR